MRILEWKDDPRLALEAVTTIGVRDASQCKLDMEWVEHKNAVVGERGGVGMTNPLFAFRPSSGKAFSTEIRTK